MYSLFLDTSQSDVTIALLKDNKLLNKINNNIPGEHSVYVTKYIEDIIKDNEITPDDIKEIVVVNGPGSFTGIRIGVTIAKMYAYLKNIRIVTITSLQAMVIGLDGDYLLSKIDAKNDNYYIGLYNRDYSKIEEKFVNMEELNNIIDKYNPTIIDSISNYNLEEILLFTNNLDSINPHKVNPIYLKEPLISKKKDND